MLTFLALAAERRRLLIGSRYRFYLPDPTISKRAPTSTSRASISLLLSKLLGTEAVAVPLLPVC